MKNTLIVAGCLLVFLGLKYALTPVLIISEDDALSQKGIVSNIVESGEKDLKIELAGLERSFYINRGLEKGLNIDELRRQILGQEILIKYPKYWTPLDWNNRVRHVAKMEFNGELIYSELL